MANITLRLEDELLSKVKRLAFERNTSVNAIVTEGLKEFVATDQKKREALAGLESFYKRTKAVVGAMTWNRDDLHER